MRSQSFAVNNGLDKSSDHSEAKNKCFRAKRSQNEEIKLGGKKTTKTVAFHKLFSFADSVDVALMVSGTIGAIGNGLRMPIMAILFGELTDAFGNITPTTFNNIVHIVSKVSLKFVYLGLGVGVAGFLQVACWMATGERQAARIRSLYLKAILRQDVAFFDKEANTGEIVERMSGDTVLIQDAMGEKVGKFIQLVATFAGGVVVALHRGWLLTLVLASTIPLLVAAGAFTSIVIGKMASRGQSAYDKAANVVEQTIGSIRTVASFTGEKRAISAYKKFLVSAYKAGVLEGLHAGLGLGMVMMVMFCTYALATWYGSKLVVEKGYTGSAVVNVIIAVLAASMSLGMASPCITAFASGQAAAYKMFETIERKPEIEADEREGLVLEDIRGDIELREVSFGYPSRPSERTLDRFSLVVPGGTTAALVGQSGSGKSTVISLIERFYDPQAGEVLIDGVNVKAFRQRWIRGKIGLVSQEPALFACSIFDNILYGKSDATEEEIRAAVELANASSFIDKLPKKLDTMVGDNGTQLSGGQKQRIAIARALLRDPRILLLDEATSALDNESEKAVQKALDQIMVNRTTVVVAHRLSTVKNADLIAVIRNGKIAEKGLHSELIKDPDGPYSQLIKLQEVNSTGQTKPAISDMDVESSKQLVETQSKIFPLQRSPSQVSSKPENISNESHDQRPRKVPIQRLASLNKQELPVLLAGTLFAAANGVILPLLGLVLSSSVKTLYEPAEQLERDSRRWSVLFVALGVASLVVVPARSYLFAVAGCNLIRRVRVMCFERAVRMEIGWFDESGVAVGARLSASAAAVRALVGDAAAQVVENLAAAVAGLVIAFAASWQLALVVLVLFPLLGVSGYVQLMFLKGFSGDAKNMYEEASQIAKDAVGNIRTVASFCGEEKVIELYKKKCEGPVETGIRQGLISGISFGISLCLIFCVYATCFYAGARFLKAGKASVLDVFRVFFSLILAAFAISQSSSLLPDSTKANAAAASVFAVIDRKSKIDPSDESGETLDDVVGEIELRDISFSYPSRPDVQIFRNLNLTIHSEKIVALVGESGGGKSTVISLLQRFYDPDSGSITLDGIEIKKLQLKWLRQQMGLVSQEPILFNDTIRANIAYGCQGSVTEAEISEAAKLANAHRFISALQQGYETVVGERGAQLSGGQKQRVAIARAIIKRPKILLLDEATSALDAESERAVQSALDRVMMGRTTVIVAHRLSTIKKAHSIAVLKNGVIVEEGNHQALINIDRGFYASLVALNHLGNN